MSTLGDRSRLSFGVPIVTRCWRARTCASSQTLIPGPASEPVSGSCVSTRTLSTRALPDPFVQFEGFQHSVVVIGETRGVEGGVDWSYEEVDDLSVASPPHALNCLALLLQRLQVAAKFFQSQQPADRRLADREGRPIARYPPGGLCTNSGDANLKTGGGDRQDAAQSPAPSTPPDALTELFPGRPVRSAPAGNRALV